MAYKKDLPPGLILMPPEAGDLLKNGKAFYQAMATGDNVTAGQILVKCRNLVKILRMMNVTFEEVHRYFEKKLNQRLTRRNDKFLVEIRKIFDFEEKGHRGGYGDLL
jgi:hypothetical protein